MYGSMLQDGHVFICGRGVGHNSIQCTSCQKWVHMKCSGIKDSISCFIKIQNVCLEELLNGCACECQLLLAFLSSFLETAFP